MAGLERFVEAQLGVYQRARDEIRAGRKTSHWMWFIFPQLAILGRSDMAKRFGLADLDEASAYLGHPVLGPRLTEMMKLMLTHAGTPPEAILGTVDAMKLRSCATLFAAVPGADPVFAAVLDAFHDGQRCPVTLDALTRG
ncbi:MAG: DUF1810 family protein [Limimaricola sp.]|uniref:DUF1810 domain-containing protein n=1 Tax=Limimaricola sp. TaxID=2211665 RepID=UPI001D1D3712|nr:DUF1810 domain-containing protein [Limimaricola sp.]MBI1417079.1 DUF1810 family protein [Limimaricola sp.]